MNYDCIVIGAGPTGATLAALLGLAGHRTLVLEKDADVYPLPRAVHMDHEIVRVMQQLGIVDALMASSSPVRRYLFQGAGGERLLDIDGADRTALSGHPASIMFVQPELEALLRDRLSSIEAVETCIPAQVLEVETGSEPAVVYLHHGARLRATARYVIGCDGASSLTRRTLGIDMLDLDFDEPWVVVDTRYRGEPLLPDDTAYQYCDPARPTTCVPGGPGRRRWEFMLLPGEHPDEMGREAAVWQLLAPWGNPDNLEIVRIAVYRFHALVARRWRHGPVLLAGDAAHQTPPFMGQGLCSGVRDAANLAWKLDRVLAGTADDVLLDSYQSEREPHVRHVVETSVAMGRIVCELDPDRAAARDAAMSAALAAGKPAVRSSQGGQVAALTDGLIRSADAGAGTLFPQPSGRHGGSEGRMDELFGCGTRLVVDDAGLVDAEGCAALGVTTVTLGAGPDEFEQAADEDTDAAAWLREQNCHAALVRPDHYVFGTARTAAETHALLDDFARRLRGPGMPADTSPTNTETAP